MAYTLLDLHQHKYYCALWGTLSHGITCGYLLFSLTSVPLAFSIVLFSSLVLVLHLFMPPEKVSGNDIQHQLQHQSYALIVIQTIMYLYFLCESPWLSTTFLQLPIKYPLLLLLIGFLITEQIVAQVTATIHLPRFIPQTYCIQAIKWFTLGCFVLPSIITPTSYPNLCLMFYSLSTACLESSLFLLGMCIHNLYCKYRTHKRRQDLLDSTTSSAENQVRSNQLNPRPTTHAFPSPQDSANGNSSIEASIAQPTDSVQNPFSKQTIV